jgi:hypothetical protein
MLNTQQTAERWNCSRQRVLQLVKSGRVIGARKDGKEWLIPNRAKRPALLKPGRKT